MELLGERICNHIVGDPPIKYIQRTCPRCLGKGIYGDINFDNTGKLVTISGVDQLKQQIKKIIIENTRSTGYGFNTNIITGGVTSDAQVLMIKRELNRCLLYLGNLQNEAQKNGFFYNNTELLNSIEKIEVYRGQDVREITAIIYCKTESGKDINLSIPIGIKSSFKLTPIYTASVQQILLPFEIRIPLVGNVTANSADAVWATTQEATGRVIYGLSPDTMIYEESSSEYTMYHQFTLYKLEMESNYYVQFFSTNRKGETINSDIILVFTGKEITIQVTNIYNDFSFNKKAKSLFNFTFNYNNNTEEDHTTIPDADVSMDIYVSGSVLPRTLLSFTELSPISEIDYTVA